jgi:hypothetical protein
LIIVVTATGNIGTSGVFLTASPASGKNVIASGSIMNNHVPGYVLKLTTTNNSQSEPKEIGNKYIYLYIYIVVIFIVIII